MYVLVQHTISDPATFWNAADPNTISPKIKLQHTFPTPDGTAPSASGRPSPWTRSAIRSSP